MSATQAYRNVAIATPLGDDKLLITNASITEQLGRLFQIQVDALSDDPNINLNDLLGGNVTMRVELPNRKTRFFNGFVSQFTLSRVDGPKSASYRMTIVPWLWFLTRTSDCRIFQDKSIPDIIKGVFREYGFVDFKDKLTKSYTPWEYCVQYRETSFNFVSRLMEHEGIYYFFEHENGKHTLVMCDSLSCHFPFPGYSSIDYRPEAGFRDSEVISDWTVRQEVQPGGYALNDFNFETPKVSLKSHYDKRDSHSQSSFEMYDYPGEYEQQHEGNTYSRVRLEELKSQHWTIQGQSNCRGIAVGSTFQLKDFPRKDQNTNYLTIAATYLIQGDEYRAGMQSDGEFYSCSFTTIPANRQFRPLRLTPKPLIQGPQTAIVTGRQGEEIYTDKYGRIKVQFHWDRYGQADQNSSCWVRVSQAAWAGKKWGAIYIPRVGQEVIVEFLEGDPDLPLVTGRVYNADAMPPYPLPDENTKTTLKSNSSPGGQGFNELRFEDAKGKEQVFIHAERDQDIRVKNDCKEYIGANRHLIVKKDQFESITGDKHLTVNGEQNQKVGETLSIQAGQNIQEKCGMRYGLQAGQEVHIKGGMNVVIEAGMSITLKAGGGFIVVGPAGVTISGTPVLINSGGSAGSGSGCSPTAPQAAQEADNGQSGELTTVQQPQPTQITATTYSPTAVTLKQAAESGTPFCEICNR